MDGGPDAAPALPAEDRAALLLVLGQHLAEACHVLDRHDDLELERLARAGIDDGDLAALPHPTEEAGDGVERPLGRAEADPLERQPWAAVGDGCRRPQPLEALEAERHVRTALRAGDRVDLVHDDLLDAAEDL